MPIAVFTPIRRYADRFERAETPLGRSLCLSRYAVTVVPPPLRRCIGVSTRARCIGARGLYRRTAGHATIHVPVYPHAQCMGVTVYQCAWPSLYPCINARAMYRCIGAKNVWQTPIPNAMKHKNSAQVRNLNVRPGGGTKASRAGAGW